MHEAVPLDGALTRRPRLMVLPFLNTSGDPAQDHFASAMTDEIITELAVFAPNDRAVEESRRIIELEPGNYVGYWLLGAATGAKGLFDDAIAAYRRSVELSGGSILMLGWLGLALGQAGRADEAREVLAQLRAAADRQVYVPPTSFAWT